MFKMWSAKVNVLALLGLLLVGVAFAVPPGTDEQIRERLQPFGDLCKAGEECGSVTAAASSGPLTGEEVYNKFCFACHAAGVGGAHGCDAGFEDACRAVASALVRPPAKAANLRVPSLGGTSVRPR